MKKIGRINSGIFSRKKSYVKEEYVSDQRYHSSKWTKLSRRFRAMHPVCERCKKKGFIVPAKVVDHIIPSCMCSDFYDVNNLQSLCEKCNLQKAAEDKNMIQEWRRSQHVG